MLRELQTRRGWGGYVFAVLIDIFAVAVRLVFLHNLELRATYVTLYPAVTLAALVGGLWPGLLATVMGALLAAYFWIEPVGRLAIESPGDMISMVVFILSCTLISVTCEFLHRIQIRRHIAKEESEQKSKLLDGANSRLEAFNASLEATVAERTARASGHQCDAGGGDRGTSGGEGGTA